MSVLNGSILRGRGGLAALLPRRADDAARLSGLDAPPRAGTGPRPSAASTLLWVCLLPVLVLVQLTVVTFLPVPWAVPDLVLVTILGLAHHRGAVAGGLFGAWAGVLLDVIPPATGAFGGWTLVLGLLGFAHGHAVASRRPGPLLALGLFGLSAAAATAGHALVLWFTGVTVAPEALLRAMLGAGAWALVLAPLALLLTGGRIGVTDPAQGPSLEPMLLDAVTLGWAPLPATPAPATLDPATVASAIPAAQPGAPVGAPVDKSGAGAS